MGRGGDLSEGTGHPPNPAPQFYQMNGFEDWYVELNAAGEEIIHLVDSDGEENLPNPPAGNDHIVPEVNDNILVGQDIVEMFGNIQNAGEGQQENVVVEANMVEGVQMNIAADLNMEKHVIHDEIEIVDGSMEEDLGSDDREVEENTKSSGCPDCNSKSGSIHCRRVGGYIRVSRQSWGWRSRYMWGK